MLQINHHKSENRTNTRESTQCMKESLFQETHARAHTSIVITLREPCVSERVYVNIIHYHGQQVFIDHESKNKQKVLWNNKYFYSRSNFILKSLVIIEANLSLNGDFERGFELDLHDLAEKNLDITIVPQSLTKSPVISFFG